VTQDPFDARVTGEDIHQRRIAADGENVDVAARVASATQAADRHEFHIGRALAKKGDHIVGRGCRIGQQPFPYFVRYLSFTTPFCVPLRSETVWLPSNR